jgi:uncharacterized membrane protein
MNLQRIGKHLLSIHWQVDRAFPAEIMTEIEAAIKASKTAHVGEISFTVEGALHSTPLFKDRSSRDRALEIFAERRVWDTEHRNGLLIYLLLADRAVEIVADRGISARVDPHEWESICRTMEDAFRRGHFEDGVISGIEAVTQLLVEHFPACKLHAPRYVLA